MGILLSPTEVAAILRANRDWHPDTNFGTGAPFAIRDCQHQRDVEWGDEECPHIPWSNGPSLPKRKCDECWKAFKKVGKESG